jgi:hypothetical protein
MFHCHSRESFDFQPYTVSGFKQKSCRINVHRILQMIVGRLAHRGLDMQIG